MSFSRHFSEFTIEKTVTYLNTLKSFENLGKDSSSPQFLLLILREFGLSSKNYSQIKLVVWK